MYSETFKVRFCETDALNHVNNTVIVQWFEAAREPIFQLFTPDLDLNNWHLIIASYTVNFLNQIFFGSTVEVRTYIKRIGSSSFEVYQEVWQKNERCAAGISTLVHYCHSDNKSKPIPDAIKEKLEQHLNDTIEWK